ncbi:MAG: hypothetical protein OSB43_11215 [Nocardioides sp.]|uniref:hypothetical protein n=1 Tax=Nocardioides sp. TaxID=35761 RepID=UPI00238FA04B|nr:hypothetical protein [Nocardioides sp.]MDE0776834.1 hypothetical protein [Nocardioides sp.]
MNFPRIKGNDLRGNAQGTAGFLNQHTATSGNIDDNDVTSTSTDEYAVRDTFDRADSTALGNTEGGSVAPHIWSQTAGAWGVLSNAAARVGGVTGSANVYEDSTLADVLAQVKIVAGSATAQGGLIVRASTGSTSFGGTSNLIFLRATMGGTYDLLKVVAGTITVVATSAVVPAVNDVIQLAAYGSTIVCRVNGVNGVTVAALTSTISDGLTNTRCGLSAAYAAGLTPVTFDNYLVKAQTTTPA